jgi:hypothetical protein
MPESPDPVNALEAAIADVLEDRGDGQRVLSLLWTSPVMIQQSRDPGEPDELQLVTVEDEEGKLYLPVYSSADRMEAALPEGADYVAIRIADLAGGWPEGVAIAVNPGDEFGFVAEFEDVMAAAESSGAADNEIIVGEPADEPSEALSKLADLLRSVDEVTRAHRVQFVDPRVTFEPQLAIGLELAPGADQQEVLQRVLARSQEEIEIDRPTVFIPVSESADDPLSSYMRERDQPFYVAADDA